ncbi:hypothetical protein DFH08DRAFT_369547 [Mycena albidolilacea]|uniref:Uncharacterized protein n=1 Tax=Mycena albidolilacea TaxID=1033008 RepID=A0AAD7AKF4_9AGAR|nr:hypothetical protein DFH08DRAFT_369547 [Mycena albidolilacea]
MEWGGATAATGLLVRNFSSFCLCLFVPCTRISLRHIGHGLGYRTHPPSLMPWRPMGTALGLDMDTDRCVHGLSECPTVILLASWLSLFLSLSVHRHPNQRTNRLSPSPATRPNTRTRPTGRDPLPQHRPLARIRTRNRNIILLLLRQLATPRRRTPPSSSRPAAPRAPQNTARQALRGGGTLLRGNTVLPRREGALLTRVGCRRRCWILKTGRGDGGGVPYLFLTEESDTKRSFLSKTV